MIYLISFGVRVLGWSVEAGASFPYKNPHNGNTKAFSQSVARKNAIPPKYRIGYLPASLPRPLLALAPCLWLLLRLGVGIVDCLIEVISHGVMGGAKIGVRVLKLLSLTTKT